MGMPGRIESVTAAAKKGLSPSGVNTLKAKLREPVEVNSKRARCFGMSVGHQTCHVMILKREGMGT